MLTAVRQPTGLEDVLAARGVHRGFPTLTVDSTSAPAPAPGAYRGTITVMIVDEG